MTTDYIILIISILLLILSITTLIILLRILLQVKKELKEIYKRLDVDTNSIQKSIFSVTLVLDKISDFLINLKNHITK